MSNRRQLLITATAKEGIDKNGYGYGLPYALPITNPTWISIEYIIEAFARNKVDIIVHNLPTPTLLDKTLYNKFLDLGYISADVIPESFIAPTVEEPRIISNPVIEEGDIVILEALYTKNDETEHQGLINIKLECNKDNFELLEGPVVLDGVVKAKIKASKPNTDNISWVQEGMGESRSSVGTPYSIPMVVVEKFEPTELERGIVASSNDLKIGDEVTLTANVVSDNFKEDEVANLRIDGTDRYMYIVEEFKINEDKTGVVAKLKAVDSGYVKVYVTQTNITKTRNVEKSLGSVDFVINRKLSAPVLSKPYIADENLNMVENPLKPNTKYKIVFNMDKPHDGLEDLIKLTHNIEHIREAANTIVLAEDKVINNLKYILDITTPDNNDKGFLKFNQVELGEDKNEDGSNYVIPFEVKKVEIPKPRVKLPPVLNSGNVIVSKDTIYVGDEFKMEILTRNGYSESELPNSDEVEYEIDKSLVKFAIEGLEDIAVITEDFKIDFSGPAESYVATLTAKKPGTLKVTVNQIEYKYSTELGRIDSSVVRFIDVPSFSVKEAPPVGVKAAPNLILKKVTNKKNKATPSDTFKIELHIPEIQEFDESKLDLSKFETINGKSFFIKENVTHRVSDGGVDVTITGKRSDEEITEPVLLVIIYDNLMHLDKEYRIPADKNTQLPRVR